MKLSLQLLVTILVGCSIFLQTAHVSYAQNCSVEVTKISEPADDTPFLFRLVDSDSNINEQKLSDPGLKTVTFAQPPSVTMVLTEEDIPDGWVLTDVTCADTSGLTFEIIENEVLIDCPNIGFLSCTFTNIFRPSVVSPIPTISEWGLITLSILLGIVGLSVIRKKDIKPK